MLLNNFFWFKVCPVRLIARLTGPLTVLSNSTKLHSAAERAKDYILWFEATEVESARHFHGYKCLNSASLAISWERCFTNSSMFR